MVEYDYGSGEIEKPPVVGFSTILDILGATGNLIIFWYLLQGYTVILLETESEDEAYMYHLTCKTQGINCVLWGDAFTGYFVLGKRG